MFIPSGHKGWTALLAAVGAGSSIHSSVGDISPVGFGFTRARLAFSRYDRFGWFFTFLNVLFLISGLAGVALAYDYLKRMDIDRGEYYSLLLFTIIGMMLMAMAGDLIVVFLALELLSIPLYVLAGFARPRPESEEAALRYFLLGAFSTGFIVYGIALVFGATGTTSIAGVYNTLMAGALNKVLLTIGAGLILIGLGFQGCCSAFPYVDAGRLPGGALRGDGVHVGGGEGWRFRSPASHLYNRISGDKL